MAIDPKKLEKVKNTLKQIKEYYKELGEDNPFKSIDPNKIAASDVEIKKLEASLRGVITLVEEANNSAENLSQAWGSMVAEARGAKNVINQFNSNLSQSANLSRQIRDHNAGLNELSIDQLENIQKELKLKKAKAESLVKELKVQEKAILLENKNLDKQSKQYKDNLDLVKKINEQLDLRNALLKEGEGLYDQSIKEAEKSKDKVSLKSKLLQAFEKGTPAQFSKGAKTLGPLQDLGKSFLGFGKDFKSSWKEMRQGFKDQKALRTGKDLSRVRIEEMGLDKLLVGKKPGSKLAGTAASAKAKSLGLVTKPLAPLMKFIKLLPKMLSKALGPISLLIELLLAFVKVDKVVGDMAKGMNLTYSSALQVKKQMTIIAEKSGDMYLNSLDLAKTLTEVNVRFGTTAQISDENLIAMTQLREEAGMTNEQIIGIYSYSKLTGKTVKESVNSFQASAKAAAFQANAALNTKALMADMAKTSKRLQLSIEGGEDGLAKAAVNAKLLGVSMSEVEGIANSLLNFESSIEAELQAELLLGRDINLEKAREAALNNDMATVAAEITKQAGSAAEFGAMNRIQQEAIAKAVGMTAEGLSSALYEQEALAALGHELDESEKRAFNMAKEKYGVEKATQMMKDGQFDQLKEQMSMADRFEKVMDKLSEIFVILAEALMPIFDTISSLMPILRPVFQILALIMRVITAITSFVADLGSAIASLWGGGDTSFKHSKQNWEGMKSTASSLVGLEPDNQMKETGDSMSQGRVMITGAEGSIFTSPNDVVAAFNPDKFKSDSTNTNDLVEALKSISVVVNLEGVMAVDDPKVTTKIAEASNVNQGI